MSKLCKELDRKWDEELNGQVVLFDWLQFLQYEALDFFKSFKEYLLQKQPKNDVNIDKLSNLQIFSNK